MRSPATALLPVLLLGACAGNVRLDDPSRAPEAARQVLSPLWQMDLVPPGFMDYKPEEYARAVLTDDGLLYIGSAARRFEARMASDGRLLWALPTQGPVRSTPLLHALSGTIYFGADDGILYAVDARTGRTRWTYASQGTINPAPVYSEGVVLFTSSEGRIYAVDAQSGKWLWQYDRELPEGFTIQGYSGAAVEGGVVYVGFADGILAALQAKSGEVLWTRGLGGDAVEFMDVDVTPVIQGDTLYAASYATGIFALSRDGGRVLWHVPVQGASGLELQGDRLYVTAPRTGLTALDLDGRQVFRQAIAKGVPSAPVLAGPYLFLCNTAGGLYAAASGTGRLLQVMDLGQGISGRPAVSADYLVILTNGGTLAAFRLAPRIGQG